MGYGRLLHRGGRCAIGLAAAMLLSPCPVAAAPGEPPAALVLATEGHALPILYDPADDRVVIRAAGDLAGDVAAVTGTTPALIAATAQPARSAILIGTLGHNRLIDHLVATGKLDAGTLKGAWESFLIATVHEPWPGAGDVLVIAGSDRRGTAYGVYELSEAMGVSPWRWWADVTPQHRATVTVPRGLRRFGPPSVRYRGIFINDEDWGLFPWAARTFDPATGNIGAKTYTKVFQLLLRLKANTLWPAMHRTTTPFNADPANARLADDYAIVMGSSHAEPMLRNNVGEWKDAPERFNYALNPAGVRTYWEERARSNGGFESIWTLGMRGIHDSGIVGATTIGQRVDLLDRVITDQRALLQAHGRSGGVRSPQMFVPYKETLDLYRAGLAVPPDVTIVWPDDNFGYIRQLPGAAERQRPGGGGIYYHLSYLGAPLSYLWLATTPPALVMTEMTRAYDAGARDIWIVNVGDIKPAEIGTSLFMEMAWNIDRWRGATQRGFLTDWSARTFGTATAPRIGVTLDDYYRLNTARRPEHLQWDVQGEQPHSSGFTPSAVDARLKRFHDLVIATARIGAAIPPSLADAYFELVDYPVRAAAAANLRYFAAERFAELIDRDPPLARSAAGAAAQADADITALTSRFNDRIAGGKWRGIMAAEPADTQWRIFRTAPVTIAAPALRADPAAFLHHIATVSPTAEAGVIEAADHRAAGQPVAGWRFVEGLGRGRGAMLATTPASPSPLSYDIAPGPARTLTLGLLPLFPDTGDGDLILGIAVDGGAARVVRVPRRTGDAAWSRGVLDNLLLATTGITLPPGRHRLAVTARSTGIALDRLVLTPITAIPTPH